MGYLDIGTIPSTFTTKEEIVGVMLKNMEVGLKISNTIPCSMLDKVLMELVEADLGLIPAPPLPIIQVVLVDYQVFILTVDNISVHRYHTSHFSAYNHFGINISHPRYTQEFIPRGVHG